LPHPRVERGLTAAAARGAAHRSMVARTHFASSTTRSDRSYCALTRWSIRCRCLLVARRRRWRRRSARP